MMGNAWISPRSHVLRTVLGLFSIIVIADIFLGANLACAQSSSEQTNDQGTVYCNQSRLSAYTFMPMVRKIIAHGDLADIPFIEKTLDIKLPRREGVTPDGNLDPYSPFYQADYVDDSAMHIDIFTWGSKTALKSIPPRADVVFKDELVPTNFIEDCLHISVDNFITYFGGSFTLISVVTGGSDGGIVGGSQVEGARGKNGSRIYVSYSVDAKNENIISGIEIRQTP